MSETELSIAVGTQEFLCCSQATWFSAWGKYKVCIDCRFCAVVVTVSKRCFKKRTHLFCYCFLQKMNIHKVCIVMNVLACFLSS